MCAFLHLGIIHEIPFGFIMEDLIFPLIQKAPLLRMPYVNLTKIYEKKCFTLTSQICTGF